MAMSAITAQSTAANQYIRTRSSPVNSATKNPPAPLTVACRRKATGTLPAVRR